jgi:hypothetical protein
MVTEDDVRRIALSPPETAEKTIAKRVTRLFLGMIGLGLLAVGATKISVTTGNAGATALILAGALLIVSPFIIDRAEQYLVAA